jgi:flagellar hook-length control protein FliK
MVEMEIASELVGAAIVPGAGTAAVRAEAAAMVEFAGLLQPALPPSAGTGQAVPVSPAVPAPVLVGPLTPGVAAFVAPTPKAEGVPAQLSPPASNPPAAAPLPTLMATASPPDETSPERPGQAAAIDEDREEPQALAVAAMAGEVPQAASLTSRASTDAVQAEVPSGELLAESVAQGEHEAANSEGGAPAAAPESPPQPQAVSAEVAWQGRGRQEPASIDRRPADAVAEAPARLSPVAIVPEQVGGDSSLEPPARAMPPTIEPAAAPAASVTAPATLHPAAPSAQASPVAEPQPAASPGTPRLPLDRDLGERLGILITRQAGEGPGGVQIRMDPAELGRIHVRLSFDEGGSLRAVVGADSPQVLEALRRDAGELGRALADAGVRTDAQSFRFDRGQSSGGGDLPRPWRQAQGDARAQPGESDDDAIRYRPLRGAGRVNLMA